MVRRSAHDRGRSGPRYLLRPDPAPRATRCARYGRGRLSGCSVSSAASLAGECRLRRPRRQSCAPTLWKELQGANRGPVCHGFFDPGVCSRSGRAVSSRDFGLVAPPEQRRSRCERLGPRIRFEGKPNAARFIGGRALHGIVGTILSSGPLAAIASFGSSEGHSLSVGPPGCRPWARKFMDAHLRGHA